MSKSTSNTTTHSTQPRLIDSLPPISRTKPMSILVLSPARSGTTSVEAALTKLNFTVYRGMKHAFLHASRGENTYPQWSEALDTKFPAARPHDNRRYGKAKPYGTEDFEKILGKYDAVVGWPASCFPDEMLAAYPEAKVILMDRPTRSWANSMSRTLVTRLTWPSWKILLPLENGLIRDCIECGQRCLNVWTDGNPRDGRALEKAYERHNEHVRSIVPEGRLLVYEAGMGWGPLCEFLGVEVPRDGEGEVQMFPREAAGPGFEKQGKIFWLMALGKVVGKGMGLGALVGLSWWALRRTGRL